MKNGISINSKELTAIVINVLTVKLFFVFPKKLVLNAGNAAWLQMIYLSVLIIPILFLIFKCYKDCNLLSVIELSEKIGGKNLKIFIGILLSIALFLNLAATMRSFPEMVKMVLLPKTPIEVIVLIFAIAVALSAFEGIESISRIHAIFIPFMVGILAIFFLFLLPHTKIYNIFPIFGKGVRKIFVTGFEGIDFFDDLLAFNLLIPYAKNSREAKKTVILGTIVSAIIAVLTLLFYCLVYSYPASENFLVPIYQLTRLVEIGDFFQRFEAFFEFIWSFSILLYSALYLQLICVIWRDCFNLKYEKPIIFPIMAIITLISFNAYDMQNIVFNYWYLSAFTVFAAFGLPTLLAIVYKNKSKKNKWRDKT